MAILREDGGYLLREDGYYLLREDETTRVLISGHGGVGTGRNLSKKQKKKLKEVESQEWLKTQETVKELLSERNKPSRAVEQVKALEVTQESLRPIIEALKQLTKEVVVPTKIEVEEVFVKKVTVEELEDRIVRVEHKQSELELQIKDTKLSLTATYDQHNKKLLKKIEEIEILVMTILNETL